jgi:hypothetical protein
LEKNKSELQLLETTSNESEALSKLDSILKQEEQKLAALLSDSANSEYVGKLQAEL